MSILIKARKIVWAMIKGPYRLRLFIYRCAPSIEHIGILSEISPRTILDIGANVGQFSVIARKLYAESHIHAFEPLAGPFGRLRAVFNGDTQVTLYRIALGASSTSMQMHVSVRNDSSSILPIGHRQQLENPGTGEYGLEPVEIKRLDDVLGAEQIQIPALVKIDVQGYELQVLMGMGLLLEKIRWILCEVSFVELYEGQPLAHELIQFLAGRGFRFCSLVTATQGKSGKIIQADILFERISSESAQ